MNNSIHFSLSPTDYNCHRKIDLSKNSIFILENLLFFLV